MKRIASLKTIRQNRRREMFLLHRILHNKWITKIVDDDDRLISLIDLIKQLKTCSDSDKYIFAILIDDRLHVTKEKSSADNIIAEGLAPILIQCLSEDDNNLLRSCACQIINNILMLSDVSHFYELQCSGNLSNILPLIQSMDEHQYKCAFKMLSCVIAGSNCSPSEPFLLDILLRISELVESIENVTCTQVELINELIATIIKNKILSIELVAYIFKIIYKMNERLCQNETLINANLTLLIILTDGYGRNDRINALTKGDFISKLIDFLRVFNSTDIQISALKVFANIVKGYDENVQLLLDKDLLMHCNDLLLKTESKDVRHEILQILSDISGGHQTEVQAIINNGLIPILIKILHTSDVESQKLTAWTFYNITSRGSLNQIQLTIECEILTVLCRLLNSTDPDIVSVSEMI